MLLTLAGHVGDEEPQFNPAIPEIPPNVTPIEEILDAKVTQPLLRALLRPCWSEYDGAEVRVDGVRLDDVRPISLIVENYRLRRAEALRVGYEKAGIEPFMPALVKVEGGYRFHVPPVVEYSRRGGEVIDGTHRLYLLRSRGQAQARALIVEPPPGTEFSPPAGLPGTWDRVRAVANKRRPREGFKEYKPDRFRPVAEFFSGKRLVFASPADCRRELELMAKECT